MKFYARLLRETCLSFSPCLALHSRKDSLPAERATDIFPSVSRPLRGLTHHSLIGPRVPLAEPRFTLGYMFSLLRGQRTRLRANQESCLEKQEATEKSLLQTDQSNYTEPTSRILQKARSLSDIATDKLKLIGHSIVHPYNSILVRMR
jgi:hypothetical protein